ncbi:YdcF family protein [Trichothermofontia sp.]
MLLFLSKLLPPLLYPLGLTCVLLGVALLSRQRWPRVAQTAIALGLAILLISSSPWTAYWLVSSLEQRHIPAGPLPPAAAIVVLGGGTKPALPPRPGVDLAEAGDRILYGAQLYREGKAPWLVLSGGRIDWMGGGRSEVADMAELAMLFGVPASAILQDTASFNTYQNAVNVRQILAAKGIQRVLLVTSALHMPRALLIFQRQGLDPIAAPTDFLYTDADRALWRTQPRVVLLNFLPDAEALAKTTRAIKEYVGMAVYRVFGWL